MSSTESDKDEEYEAFLLARNRISMMAIEGVDEDTNENESNDNLVSFRFIFIF